jgi:uncharacterized UBP type Zn finger protein
MPTECTHLDQIKVTHVSKHVCEDCVKIHGKWLHLRMCVACGHMGCCDSSPNKHASAHFRETKHPIMRSAEPGETWTWCFVDEVEPGELEE